MTNLMVKKPRRRESVCIAFSGAKRCHYSIAGGRLQGDRLALRQARRRYFLEKTLKNWIPMPIN